MKSEEVLVLAEGIIVSFQSFLLQFPECWWLIELKSSSFHDYIQSYILIHFIYFRITLHIISCDLFFSKIMEFRAGHHFLHFLECMMVQRRRLENRWVLNWRSGNTNICYWLKPQSFCCMEDVCWGIRGFHFYGSDSTTCEIQILMESCFVFLKQS